MTLNEVETEKLKSKRVIQSSLFYEGAINTFTKVIYTNRILSKLGAIAFNA